MDKKTNVWDVVNKNFGCLAALLLGLAFFGVLATEAIFGDDQAPMIEVVTQEAP